MHVGLDHERVTPPAQGRARLFSGDRMAALHHQTVDLNKQLRTQKAHIVHRRLVVVARIVPDIRMAKEPAQRLVLVHQLVETVEIAAQTLLDHPHHENPPHLHPRPPHGPVDAGKHVLVHQRKQPHPKRLVAVQVLKPQQQRRNVVPGLEVQLDVLNADFAQPHLRIADLSHPCLAKIRRNRPESARKTLKPASPSRSSHREYRESSRGVNGLRIFWRALSSFYFRSNMPKHQTQTIPFLNFAFG